MTTALSLVCGDCGAQLRSAQEAQDHADVTGHANFAESTEPVGMNSWIKSRIGSQKYSRAGLRDLQQRAFFSFFYSVCSLELTLALEVQVIQWRTDNLSVLATFVKCT